MTAYRANILFTPEPDAFVQYERGYVVVDDHGLVVGTYADLGDEFAGIEVVDYGEKLLIPAMNDMHVHAPQYRNMGLAMDLQLLPWLEHYTFPEERKYADTDYARRMYSRFVHELWMQGTMRSVIFATIHPESTALLMQLLQEAGMGAYVGLVGMNRNCPDYLSNTTDELLAGMRRLSEMATDRVQPIITPRFVPTCSDDMLHALGELARETGMPVQSHLSENVSEIEWVKQLQPNAASYGEAYHIHGLFGQTPTLMAHCCYTEGEELELMRRQGVYAVHCPTSNVNLASGISPVRHLMDAGVPVALGTDVSGGNNLSVLRVIQYAIQMSKLQYALKPDHPRWLSLSEAFYLATKGGGAFFGQVGSFEPGYAFDALVVDDSYLNYDHYTLSERIERYIYLGDDRDIKHRFCMGQEIKEPCIY